MEIQNSNSKKILSFIALLSTTVIVNMDFVIYPIVMDIYQYFPNNTAGVNFIISGPAIIILFASLVVPYLAKVISKRNLLIIASILFSFASIGGTLIESVPYMIACRIVCALCYAVANVAGIGLIADVCVDETNRAKLMGIYNAAVPGIGALMGLVAGNLALSGWQNAYKTYWIAIPMTILVILFIPKTKSVNERAKEVTQNESVKLKPPHKGLGSKFWIMMIDFAVFGVCYCIPFLYFSSVYVTEHNLGDTAFVGILSSVSTIASAVLSFLSGFIYGKLKARTSLPSYILLTASLVSLYLIHSQAVTIIAAALAGAAFGTMFCFVYAHGTAIVDPEKMELAIGIATAVGGGSMFATTYVATWLMRLFNTDKITPTYIVLIIAAAIVTVVEIVNATTKKKQESRF